METTRFAARQIPEGAFVNDAGWIANVAFGEFRCVSLIWSKAGSFRSKHYHLTDQHTLYVLSGEMWYWERELDGKYPDVAKVVRAGESVHTGALVPHQTYFPIDTLLVSASKRPRDMESHEQDVVRVDEEWQVVS